MGALPEFPPAQEFIKVKKFQVGFGKVGFDKLMSQVFQKKWLEQEKKSSGNEPEEAKGFFSYSWRPSRYRSGL